MALFPIHDFFVFNNDIKPVSEFVPSENTGGIYEVFRVVNGVPLFLEEHLDRFYTSARIAQKEILFSPSEIKGLLKELTDQNKVSTGNVLISCKTNLKAFFLQHKYPTARQYIEGVPCDILKAERANPNAKVFQTSIRFMANEMIEQKKIYEAILVDSAGRITEGSRSNLFFVKGEKLCTPPAYEVLLGITRKKTIRCAKDLNIEVCEEDIWLKDLHTFDAVFITGTSPKILPVKQIGEARFDVKNKILNRLLNAYDLLIETYVKQNTGYSF